jgi:hypothetical protein
VREYKPGYFGASFPLAGSRTKVTPSRVWRVRQDERRRIVPDLRRLVDDDSVVLTTNPASTLRKVDQLIRLSWPCQYFSRSSRFRIFPAASLGRTDTKSIDLGIL